LWVRAKEITTDEWHPPDWVPPKLHSTFKKPKGKSSLPQRTDFDAPIPLQEGKHPRFGPIYSTTSKEEETLDEYLQENLANGFIQPSNSPAGHPILFVPKKDGTLRICVDYRTLNDITIKNRGPLPLINDIFDMLQGAKVFTTLDLITGYHHVRIKRGDEWKTAFRCKRGLFEYTVMPMGLTNAPAIFQNFMNHVLRRFIGKTCAVYLDDIIIFSKDPAEHQQHVIEILEELQKNGLYVKGKKSEFAVTEVPFLGAIVTPEGIKMDPKKVQSILDWPAITTLKELQAFLGLANYYRRFIKGYSRIATPLTALTKKDTRFEMTAAGRKAMKALQEAFTTAPILKLFDPKLPIRLETDASDGAIGACLTQKHGKLWHPVAYLSKKFDQTELRYQIHDKELMAIVEACKVWRAYLQTDEPFEVYTDHKNLTYFMTTKELNRRQVRWWEKLAEYNMKIQYTKGSDNGRADALSRRPDYMKDITPDSGAILQENKDNITIRRSLNLTAHIVENELGQLIKTAYKKDATANRILENSANLPPHFNIENGYVSFDEKYYVPSNKDLQTKVIELHHDTPAHGHLGMEKTYELINKNYYWLHMRKDIEEYVKTCDSCLRNKPNRRKPFGKLQPHDAPTRPFEVITYDFIQGVPKARDPLTNQIYNEILVVTCKLTKMIVLIPWKDTWGAKELAQVYNERIFAKYGMSLKHICDRDPLFSSKYWAALMNQSGTKLNIATKGHAQTDGASERLIQTTEIYLRAFLNYEQNNWLTLLPMAEFTYNSAKHSATGITPFEGLMGRNPTAVLPPLKVKEEVLEASQFKTKMDNIQKSLKEDIEFSNERMAHYYNLKRSGNPSLKEGDKVYLLAKNIKTRRPNKKLDYQKLGPYKITKKHNNIIYELAIPGKTRIHKTFHISLLEPVPKGLREQAYEEELLDNAYDAEKLLDQKEENGKTYYLVRWEDYGPEDDSWVLEEDIGLGLIQEYHEQNK